VVTQESLPERCGRKGKAVTPACTDPLFKRTRHSLWAIGPTRGVWLASSQAIVASAAVAVA
jgi:hypothetical protein